MTELVNRKTEHQTRQRGNYLVTVLSILCLCLFTYLFVQWQNTGTLFPVWGETTQSDERTDGSYFTLYDAQTGEAIEYMSRHIYVGDELLLEDNRHYRVVEVQGDSAKCELLGERAMQQVLEELYSDSMAVSTGESSLSYMETAARNFQSIAIYCTHTDESYVPTSGTESKHGGGDILDVAETMVVVLEEQGIPVIHSENLHDPHDVNAYQRSRKTASELLQGAPAVIIDVHRDGIPDPEYYATEFEGESATQIRIVVGRQNQNSEANIAFAEKMKAYYDDVKPGLIKSIFMAKGNYNQDLAPNSVLLEVGTHTNTLEAAQNGAKEFAEVLPQFLGLKVVNGENTASDGQNERAADTAGDGMGRAIMVLLLVVLLGGGAYLLINRGGGRV